MYDPFEEIFSPINEDDNPFKAFFKLLICALILYAANRGINHVAHIGEIVGNSYSSGGKVCNVLLFPVALVIILIAIPVFILAVINLVKIVYIIAISLPKLIKNETKFVKHVWRNKGFGKYRPFGGFLFYLKLRQRVLAYVCAFLAIGITAWFFAFKQHTYEQTYWKINFYQEEPLPYFTFKPYVIYTIETSANYYAVTINGRRFVMGDNSYFANDMPYRVRMKLPEIWNINFPETTVIHFEFYRDAINQIFSQTLEVSENKHEGTTIHPSQFYDAIPNTEK